MVSLEAFSELLEVLYSAPLQDEQWQRFLTLLSRHTQASLGLFLCADSRLGLSIRAQGGSMPFFDQAAAYNEVYARSDPFRTAVLRKPRTGIVQGDDLLPNEGLLRTDMYRQLLAPNRVRYATLILLTIAVRRLEAITLWRLMDHGPMDEDCNRLLTLLFPHIQKALQIRQVLGVTQQRLSGAEAMIDASSTATFLLTREGRILHSNVAAGSLLRETDALAVQDGHLVATVLACREPLCKFFLNAALPFAPQADNKPSHALSLRRCAGRQPLQLLASPLPPAHRGRSGADLVLLVTDPENPVNYPDDVLRALYGLTPAETEIANGLLTGYTLEEIAGLRQVSRGTIRQQLKSILSKTGTKRQSDLVRLLMTLPSSASAN